MLLKELLIVPPIVCLIDDYLLKTAQIIAENDLDCLPVVESLVHKNLIGVITEKEICRKGVAAGLDPSKTTVGRVMSCRYLSVDGDTDVEECRRIMKENKADYVLVTDKNNSCLGVISREDLPDTGVRFHNQNYSFQYIKNDRIF